jgi:hypothetical protein
MTTSRHHLTALVIALAGIGAAVPPLPATPASIREVVLVQPFELDTAYRYDWRKDRPNVREGYVLVIRVDPELVRPRADVEPVLYVGKQTAERFNVGHGSGHVVAFVPTPLAEDDPEHVDLERAIIWFGDADMPERIDAQEIQRQHDRALAAGIAPSTREAITRARERGGKLVHLPNKDALTRHAADLVERYAPDEADLVRQIRPGSSRREEPR